MREIFLPRGDEGAGCRGPPEKELKKRKRRKKIEKRISLPLKKESQ